MAKASAPPPRHATISAQELPDAVDKMKRRLTELRGLPLPGNEDDLSAAALTIATKVNATLVDVYGAGTVEAEEARVNPTHFAAMFAPCPWPDELEIYKGALRRLYAQLQAMLEVLEERLVAKPTSPAARARRAFDGLDLHPEISRAVTKLYQDGHYANAIEDAVKALNAFVRYRSGESADGMALMERVFSPTNPILRFNPLADQSDRDEQKGFMMMFSGAVAGLRNPRAHKLMQDAPESALEFIAFVSLLAKLVDRAAKA